MDLADAIESGTHSFIVKVWAEKSTVQGGQTTWRGHITHVPDGERRYVTDLSEVADFMELYLQRLGVKVTPGWKVRDWIRTWRRS